jgi:hypothetical protein
MNELLQQLAEPFPKEVESVIKKGNARLTYIPVNEVINRLNVVLGVENWSYEIVSCARDTTDADWIVAHVRLTAIINGAVIHRDGYGGVKIKYMKSGSVLDLGDEFKGASSDALKKAAMSLGVSAYLARSDAALEIEAAEAAVEATDPQVKAAWDNFLSLAKGMDEDTKNGVASFWVEYSGDRPKPTLETASVKDLIALSEEIIRLSFGADKVEEASA